MKMKDKRQKDAEAQNKKRSTQNLRREKASKSTRKSFLIICEGKNTEPSYFKQFKLPTAEVETIGTGRNTYSLVEHAIIVAEKLNKKRLEAGGSIFDEIWCVFDVDPKPDNPNQVPNFTNALALAESKNIQVAYSNQAFEYWFILHFEDHQGGPMHRDGYHGKINSYLANSGCEYDGKGSKEVSTAFFDKMLEIIERRGESEITRQDKAIERAKRNLDFHKGTLPVNAESSTTVFRLVEKLTFKT
jgi:coproporphyrinogen III oxidase